MVSRRTYRIATRGSELALWQARAIRAALLRHDAELAIELSVIRTTGDRILDVPLARIGDRGLFTKEIDDALLRGEADLAVHSLKDVPTRLPEGLVLSAVTQREDPRDVLIGPPDRSMSLRDLPPGARVGTSSLRRRAQLRATRPDVEVVDLRGNLNTRLAKLDRGEYDAILLAAAGVLRLGWKDRISEYLSPPEWLPAVGQGALAVVTRERDDDLHERLGPLHDDGTSVCVVAERSLLHALQGGCQIPIGALATLETGELKLHALISDPDGSRVLRETGTAPGAEAESLGRDTALHLLRQGGDEILRALRSEAGHVPPPPPP